jgi:tetratricopeptide (TPR) repeat protein
MGLWYLRRGQFAKAEPFFRKAISTLTQRNSNPYEGEVYYNLGWALKMQNKNKEAFDAFYKSVWNDAWQHAGYLNLARMAVVNNSYDNAFDFIQKSLIKNYHSHTARHLKAVLLRKWMKYHDAAALIEESLELDPFNFGCLFEKYLLLSLNRKQDAAEVLKHLRTISRDWVHNFIEYAFDYAHAGLYDEARLLLSLYAEGKQDVYPMVEYYQGWFAYQSGQMLAATKHFEKAALLKPDFVFPNRIEDVAVLEKAMQVNPKDAKAAYYLGNFWYDKRQYKEAIDCWEKSVSINDSFPTAHRNLSLAYYNKLNDPERALVSLEKAFSLDKTDARVLMEFDQLYKKFNKTPKERLIFLENHLAQTVSRDDLYLERITLLNQVGEFHNAKKLLAAHTFHPWEGGEGKIVKQYLICHLELTKQAIEKGEYQSALELLNNAENYPSNLGEGKLPGVQENDINFLKGLAYDYLGLQDLAENFYRQATIGISEPVQAIFYNDPQPDKIFYQGLAWSKLNEKEKANAIFRRLIEFGEKHLNDHISIDYFAVSLPDLLVFDADLDLRNKVHCLYVMALGHMGLGNRHSEKAEQLFDEVLHFDINHQGAAIHKQMMNYLLFVV